MAVKFVKRLKMFINNIFCYKIRFEFKVEYIVHKQKVIKFLF